MYRNNYPMYNQDGDRIFFPFLAGAVVGGAAVGLTRPRPVYVTQPYYYPNYGYGYPSPYPYGYSSYSYYYPRYY